MLILTFTAAGNRYAVEVARVVEVVPRVELREMPHAPGFLAGLLEYRGQVVPVIDLGLLLGGGPSPDRLSTRIILVNPLPHNHNRTEDAPAGKLLGLIAEQVSDLTRIQPDQVIPAPVLLPDAPYLDTIAQTDQGFLPMIQVSRLSQYVVGD